MPRLLFWLSCVLAAATVSVGVAQGPGGFGPPMGAFGFGPPGAMESPAAALLWMPEVQRELALTGDQVEQVGRILRELDEEVQASMGDVDFAELATLSDDERQQRFAEFRRTAEEIGQAADEALRAMLDAAQTERLKQLQLQRAGAQALADGHVITELGLSDEQQATIEGLLPSGFGAFGPPAEDEGLSDELLAVLTDEQRALWDKLIGQAFDFPAIAFGRGPGGFGGPGGGFRGFGGPGGQTREILADFDKNGDGWLNADERKGARESLAEQGQARGGFPRGGPFGGRRGPGGRGGPFGRTEPGTPGPHVDVADVVPLPSTDLYDQSVVRTIFLEFENADWEAELEEFHNTDVDVPATLIVDGQRYPKVGIRFRGASSYMMLPRGSKRSLNVSLDLADEDQRLYGAKSLNLLNAHEDPTFLHTVLYSRIAREYIPAPKANFVRVVINGESWGLYVNAQQFDKIFAAENYGDGGGTRWKVAGSPGADGGLRYLGDELAEYRRRYEIKGDDTAEAWQPFIELCRVLNETPAEELEAALEPLLDVEGALWFLALENALINSDGYWIRASDYSVYREPGGKFHVIPHDMNEVFQPAMGGGPFGGGPGGGRGGRGGFGPTGGFGGPGGGRRDSYDLDPLVGLDDSGKPLRSKLLAVPALRARYLEHVREIADQWLEWDRLGPIVAEYVALIEDDVEADTRKLSSFEEFLESVSPQAPEGDARHSLYEFARRRREFLLNEDAGSQ
jgi:hypothetical protein